MNSIDSNLQVKAMLIFYTFFSLISYINFKKIKIKKSFKGVGEANFSLKIVLSSTESVYLFLFNLIVENFNRIENNEINLLSKNVFLDSKKNNIQHIISVPAKTFFDVDDFFSKSIKE